MFVLAGLWITPVMALGKLEMICKRQNPPGYTKLEPSRYCYETDSRYRGFGEMFKPIRF